MTREIPLWDIPMSEGLFSVDLAFIRPDSLLSPTCIGCGTNKDPEGYRSISPPSHQTASLASCLLTYEDSFTSQLGTENVISYPSHERASCQPQSEAWHMNGSTEAYHFVGKEQLHFFFISHFYILHTVLLPKLSVHNTSTTSILSK